MPRLVPLDADQAPSTSRTMPPASSNGTATPAAWSALCLAAHMSAGLTDTDIALARESTATDAHDAALLNYAVRVLTNSWQRSAVDHEPGLGQLVVERPRRTVRFLSVPVQPPRAGRARIRPPP